MNKYTDNTDTTCSSSVRSDEEVIGVEAGPWQFAYREALGPCILKTVLISIALFLVTFTLAGPIGTDDLTWMQRLAHFGIGAFLCTPLCYAKYVVVLYVTRFWSPFQIALAVAGGTFLASLPSTAIVYAVDTLIRTEVPSYGLPKMYLFVASSMLLFSAFTHYMVAQRLKSASAASPSAAPVDEDTAPGRALSSAPGDPAVAELPSRFLDRLPPEIGRDIIYLKMSDHYVEVVTTVGRCAILMRFADAITDLGGHGVRVHRSYWAAYPHVRGWARRNQRTLLRLTGDHVIPVSRTYRSGVREAVERRQNRADAPARPPTGDGSGHA